MEPAGLSNPNIATAKEVDTAAVLNCWRGELSFSGMSQDRKHPCKLALRKWLSANGVPSTYAARLSFAELEAAWNDTSDATIHNLMDSATIGSATPRQSTSAPVITIANDPFAPAVTHKEPAAMTINVNPDHAATANAANAANDALAGLMTYISTAVSAAASQSVNEERVRAIVEEAMSGVAPRAINVISSVGSVIIEERTNPVFERILKLVSCGENVLIVGPAGCGKTHLVEQVAKALGRKFGMLSGSAGASESQIMGWLLPSEGGKFEYQPSEFIQLYEEGNSVFLFDEYDAFDGNMLLCANSALANGHITVPQRLDCPRVKRGDNVAIISTANTYGTGADPIYSGRNQLDGATLDRFVVVEMTYDTALEADIAKAGGMTTSQLERFHKLRAKVEQAGLLRVISTRALKKTISNMRCGMDYQEALADLTTGWSADEKQRAGL